MRTAAVVLLGLGATSFLFPLIGRRSLVMGFFGPHEKAAAIAGLVLGAILLALSFRKAPAKKDA